MRTETSCVSQNLEIRHLGLNFVIMLAGITQTRNQDCVFLPRPLRPQVLCEFTKGAR